MEVYVRTLYLNEQEGKEKLFLKLEKNKRKYNSSGTATFTEFCSSFEIRSKYAMQRVFRWNIRDFVFCKLLNFHEMKTKTKPLNLTMIGSRIVYRIYFMKICWIDFTFAKSEFRCFEHKCIVYGRWAKSNLSKAYFPFTGNAFLFFFWPPVDMQFFNSI